MELSAAAPQPLPPLREELSLHPSAPGNDGTPRWVIEDPITHRFYELDWSSFEVLRRWGLRQPEQIVEQVNSDTALTLSTEDVEEVRDYLAKSNLLQQPGGDALYAQWRQGQRSKLTQLLHSYLFFRIPLIHPDKMLDRIAPLFQIGYQPAFWQGIFIIALLGLFLVIRQWEQFVGTFAQYGQWQDWIWFGLALIGSKCLHELGHALSARRYGCRVPTMGVAFLVLWPVLYTDTNEVWKLTSRRARLVVAASGMAAELALASLATLAWSLTPDGPLRSALFFLASTSWLITLGINLNPFMRFDGYFLLSDWLRQPNLHGRSFAMGRWWLRKNLFGLNDPPPETLPKGTQHFMIWFAFGTWLYRLVLFLGIALMVYHLFFKVLGIFLMIVELAWFIGKPISGEFRVWWQRRAEIRSQPRALIPLALVLLTLLLLLWPWSHPVRAPALIQPSEQQTFYANSAALVKTVHVQRGDRVEAGQLLISLESPDLAFEQRQAEREIGKLRWQLERQTSSAQLLQEGDLIRERLIRAHGELQRIQSQQQQLRVYAPFSGRVTDLNPEMRTGHWVAKEEALLSIAQPTQIRVEALIAESDLGHLDTQQPATLIPAQPELEVFSCRTIEVETVALPALPSPHLASIYGGPVAVNPAHDGRLIPDEATYRLSLSGCDLNAPLASEQIATAHLASTPYSLMQGLWRRIQGTLIRESGF